MRIVTGLPPIPCTTLRYASNCSSSVGSPSRLRNRNSERKRPMPLAPLSSVCATSSGSSMLAESSTSCPSIVIAGLLLSRFSFARSSPISPCFSRYSASTDLSGLTMTTSLVPSTIRSSFSRISWRPLCVATTAGTLRLRATIAVCDVTPPRSVMNAPKRCCLNWMTSAGERSCATRIVCASAPGAPTGPGLPIRRFSTRSTTCTTSALRSRRYGSSIWSNCSTSTPICCASAHSALQRCSAMIRCGASTSVGSLRIIQCTSRNAPNSAGASPAFIAA